MAKARGLKVTILTTGLLLVRHAPWIASGVDDVIVSLDGPREIHDRIRGVTGAFDALVLGVRALREQRSGFPIAARCTVQKANCREMHATVAAAKSAGFDSISFLAADVASDAFDHAPNGAAALVSRVALDEGDVEVLAAQVETLIAHGIAGNFVRESAEKLRRIVHHFRAALGQCEPIAPRCNAPWVSAVMETDGTVRPCFFHRPLGNAGAGRLDCVINGREAIDFRSGLDVANNETCRKCVCSLYVEPPAHV
jgi:MoaA/NifB/PqqE/SkfB family radical SAM enzyme